MKLSTRQYRILVLSQQRGFTDTLCWLVLFLLIVGFQTVFLLWQQPHPGMEDFLNYVQRASPVSGESGNWPQAFSVILKDSLLYTIGLMLMVYFNLLIIKPYTLDQKHWSNAKRYTTYLSTVVITSVLFSLLFAQVATWLDFIRYKFNYPINIMANFCFSFISTGLVHLRALKQKERFLLKAKMKNAQLKTRLEEVSDALESAQQALQGVTVSEDHLKIGNRTNYRIIHFGQILFLKGDGNEPRLILNNGKRPFAGGPLKELEERLPATQFLRVHRSYIINKDKIIAREGQQFIISDPQLQEEYQIPISDSYLQVVQEDWHPNLSFGDDKAKPSDNHQPTVIPADLLP